MAEIKTIKIRGTTYDIRDESKLPVSGGTITGNLKIADGNNDTSLEIWQNSLDGINQVTLNAYGLYFTNSYSGNAFDFVIDEGTMTYISEEDPTLTIQAGTSADASTGTIKISSALEVEGPLTIGGSHLIDCYKINLSGSTLETKVESGVGRLYYNGNKVLFDGEGGSEDSVTIEEVETYLDDNSEEVDLTNYFTKTDVNTLFNSIFEFDGTTLIIKDN